MAGPVGSIASYGAVRPTGRI